MEKTTGHMKHTIFWADDDLDDLMLIGEFLRLHAPHHEMIEFADGQELFTHLKGLKKEQHPCLIVLDMNMPRLSGKETLMKLKQEHELQSIPVIVFTTSVRNDDQAFFDSYGVQMITKPLSLNQLRDSIKTITEICDN